MFQEYFSNNIVTKFVKELLRTTNIPTVPVWRPGKSVIKDFIYITPTHIVRALKDFTSKTFVADLSSVGSLPICTGDDYLYGNYYTSTDSATGHITYWIASSQNNATWVVADYHHDIEGPQSGLDGEYFEILEPYVEGDQYLGITSTYTSNSAMYDLDTHEHLGDYLRMHRDLHGIDLMPYYNCWNGTYSDKLRFSITLKGLDLITDNTDTKDGKKVLVVPIKFNQKYTIYINSNYPIQMFASYYDNVRLIKKQVHYTPIEIQSCSNAHPYVFQGVRVTGESVAADINGMKVVNNTLLEEYLTLFIQIPESNTSSIFILEGDYSDVQLLNIYKEQYNAQGEVEKRITLTNRLKQTIYGNMYNLELSDEDLNKYCRTPSSLSRVINGKSYAFNNRLIEYLLWNVIDSNESIDKNIERIQKYITSYKLEKILGHRYKGVQYTNGVWDGNLRRYVFDLVTSKITNPLCVDINGFIDKDTETLLLRGKE